MLTWLKALQDLHDSATAAVLVTVAASQGSVPREAGARMVLSATRQFDSIGGGHLEWRATQIARAMLASDPALPTGRRKLERMALGPALGQCCGGVVLLAFERIDATVDASVSDWLARLQQHCQQGRDVWRAVPLESLAPGLLLSGDGSCALPAQISSAGVLLASDQTQVLRAADGQAWLLDHCRAAQPQVVLFGAGHVGAAIVRVLCTLPCRILWVDAREDLFPAELPPQVSIETTDVPHAVVDLARPGAYFLVMTHSHALDQQLAEHILGRSDIAWFGLIGSRSKRQQFTHRLQARGITPAQLSRMHCPIGLPGIKGKQPASIAIAVAAQLLQLWELQQAQQQAAQEPAPPPAPPPARSATRLITQALDGRH